jgi:hypothetical protein
MRASRLLKMATTSFTSIARSYGGRSKGVVSPGVLTMSVLVSGDSAQTSGGDAARMRIGSSATEGELFVLPKGAIPIQVVCIVAGTASDTVDIGTSGDPNGFFVGAPSHTKGTITGASGALVTAAGTTDDEQVYIDANAGSPTGTVSFVFTYTVVDDGVAGEQQR